MARIKIKGRSEEKEASPNYLVIDNLHSLPPPLRPDFSKEICQLSVTN